MGSITEFFKQNAFKENENTKPHKTDVNFALPPECDTGNIEYKLKIVSPTKNRFQHLVTQMKWRLQEGNGEAVYEIGVEDSGALTGIDKSDMEKSTENIKRMAQLLEASATKIFDKELENGRMLAEILIRKLYKNREKVTTIRVAVTGGPDAGKSTLLGVLTQGHLDNSRGRARLNMFRHLHEVQSGQTSSVSHEFIGFDSQGKLVNYNTRNSITAEDISVESSKLVTFLDLAGHEKYLKTTIQGLCGYFPNYAMLVISSTSGLVNMTYEHLNIVIGMNLMFFVVITQTDLKPPGESIQEFENVILSTRKCESMIFYVRTMNDAVEAASNLANNLIPVFCVSSVSGSGLELLVKFLHTLPGENTLELQTKNCEFQIDDIFSITHVGKIVSGFLIQGMVHVGDQLLIGPICGSFKPVFIESIHQNKVPCQEITPSQTAAIKLKYNNTLGNLRRGMVLIKSEQPPPCCVAFEASITLLSKTNYICSGLRCTIYIGSIRQSATIENVVTIGNENEDIHRKWSIRVSFFKHAEYVREGDKLFFKQGDIKGVGEITKIYPINNIMKCKSELF